jgi:alkanesulfonate monooxygenase SsuD/methylene tetrahydromethanopterin reductase-like flavin-dependent oxidoreductase (luciferase family)
MAEVGAAIVGNPDEALAQCRRWEAAGCDQISFGVSGGDLEASLETIRLLGEHVIPKIDTEPLHSTTRYRQAAAKS